ncbi:hypothetical protein G7054_g3808 [Neopestalotiopsis clavispora]|nr:hypothetical protein G7054_g3808 [Neopestalotiopsis clavispora]
MSVSRKEDWLVRGTGATISSVSSSSLALSGHETLVSSRGGCELLCSYNWINRARPSIYVPGGAPVFKEVPLPIILEKDSGLQYIDQNAARVPKYPFEVVFDALQAMNPNVTFDEIDVLVNRNSLRRLLEFCQGRRPDSFRLNLFVIDNTLIIERCTKSAKQMIHGSANAGYGKSFEHAITEARKELQGSMGHHCVLKYNLGSLNCAVRFEVDACVIPTAVDPQIKAAGTRGGQIPSDVNRLTGDLQALNLDKKQTSALADGGTMHVIRSGPGTSPSHMAEIKANAKPARQSLPQMWFGRTPHLIRGTHDEATFTKISVDDISQNFEVWENNPQNQEALQKMVGLISQLRDMVQATPEKSCVAVYRKSPNQPSLNILHSTNKRKPLPVHVTKRFWKSQN